MKRLAVLSFVLLGGCASVTVAPPTSNETEQPLETQSSLPAAPPLQASTLPKPSTPTKANVLLARTAAKQLLKDADSARFKLEVQYPQAICGFVNSKNSFGGYVGDSPYIYVNATRDVFILQHLGSADERIDQLKTLRRYCPD
jgi:hypothetical protein